MIASASADDYQRALEALAADPSVDAVVAIFIPPLVTQADDVADAVRAASAATRAAGKPLLAVWMAQDDAALATLAGGVGGVPAYGTPEEAVRALAHAAGYARWRRTATEPPEKPAGVDADAAAATVAEVLAEGGGWLVPDRVAELLSAYGIPQVAATVVATPAAVGAPRRRARRRGRDQGDRARARAQVRRRRRQARHPRRGRRQPRGARDRRRRARGRPPAGRLPRAGDGARRASRCWSAWRRIRTGVPSWRAPPAAPPSSCSATCNRAWRRSAATTPRRCSARCARSRCSTATGARRAPTSRRSRTSWCASPRSPPPTPRSPSSTATRCWWGPAARPWSTPASESRCRRPPRPYPSLDR